MNKFGYKIIGYSWISIKN